MVVVYSFKYDNSRQFKISRFTLNSNNEKDRKNARNKGENVASNGHLLRLL